MSEYDLVMKDLKEAEKDLCDLRTEEGAVERKICELRRALSISYTAKTVGGPPDPDFYEKKSYMQDLTSRKRILEGRKKELRQEIGFLNRKAVAFHVSCKFLDEARRSLSGEDFEAIMRRAVDKDQGGDVALIAFADDHSWGVRT